MAVAIAVDFVPTEAEIATARRTARLHFPDRARPGRCFRCHGEADCEHARWADSILAIADRATPQ